MGCKNAEPVVLGGFLKIEDFMGVVREHRPVEFSKEFCERVNKCRAAVEQCVEEERVVYGTTTGFGALVTKTISKEQAEKLQRNIVITHATTVGEPFGEEVVRAIILMVLQSLGRGVSGVRLELLERYRDFLNKNLIPFVPREGSVGYLCAEGHIAVTLIGEGKAFYEGQLYDSKTALEKAGMEPFVLSYKEGLALLNGESSSAAMAAVGIYSLNRTVRTADITAAMSLEMLNGLIRAYDQRIMDCRPQEEIAVTANNVKKILEGSDLIEEAKGTHVQDSLSLRCVPQLHGAAKRVMKNAWDVVEVEINSCADNPILYGEGEDIEVFSNGNPDASFSGIQMDAACIAATTVGKMSERRNARFLDENLSPYPYFLVKNPGLNSGLMIPQYTQAGLLNDMRILSTPATIDNVSTSANQEDYVAMGYNACKKALEINEKLEYVLAIELLSIYQSQQFVDESKQRGKGSQAALEEIKDLFPVYEEDAYWSPCIEKLKELIHSGRLLQAVENKVGEIR